MPKKMTAKPTKPVGDYWISSLDGQIYKDQKVDATVIQNARENPYLASVLWQQQTMIFQKNPRIEVYDVEGDTGDTSIGRALERHNKTIKRMAEKVDYKNAMVLGWQDQATWGPHIVNDYWDYNGSSEIVLKALTRLDPYSFRGRGATFSTVYNPILPGILVNKDKELEFWQTQSDHMVRELDAESITMLTNPLTPELGGRPLIKPLIPITRMISTAWSAQMQQNSILGAGGVFFAHVEDGSEADYDLAKKALKNANRGVKYVLPKNITIENLGISTTATALETINALDRFLTQFWSPSKFISKDGTLIGGSSGPEFDLYVSYISAMQAPIETGYAAIFQKYGDKNGWDDRYRVRIVIPEPEPNKSDLFLKAAELGSKERRIGTNEFRAILVRAGVPQDLLPALDEKGMVALAEENARLPQPASPFSAAAPLQAQALTAAARPRVQSIDDITEATTAELEKNSEKAMKGIIKALRNERGEDEE
ncbi:MAG: hypothetical protein WC683_05075 [bacterium]